MGPRRLTLWPQEGHWEQQNANNKGPTEDLATLAHCFNSSLPLHELQLSMAVLFTPRDFFCKCKWSRVETCTPGL